MRELTRRAVRAHAPRPTTTQNEPVDAPSLFASRHSNVRLPRSHLPPPRAVAAVTLVLCKFTSQAVFIVWVLISEWYSRKQIHKFPCKFDPNTDTAARRKRPSASFVLFVVRKVQENTTESQVVTYSKWVVRAALRCITRRRFAFHLPPVSIG